MYTYTRTQNRQKSATIPQHASKHTIEPIQPHSTAFSESQVSHCQPFSQLLTAALMITLSKGQSLLSAKMKCLAHKNQKRQQRIQKRWNLFLRLAIFVSDVLCALGPNSHLRICGCTRKQRQSALPCCSQLTGTDLRISGVERTLQKSRMKQRQWENRTCTL